MACNRLFVLMSPWGGLPCVFRVNTQAPDGVQFFTGGIPENPDLDE